MGNPYYPLTPDLMRLRAARCRRRARDSDSEVASHYLHLAELLEAEADSWERTPPRTRHTPEPEHPGLKSNL